jgi:hypothetical protein
MTQQVISIGPDGSMSGLQMKPGKGVDLRQFGRAQIERASEVQFDVAEQAWFVEIRKGKYAGRKITYDLWSLVTGNATLHRNDQPVMMFREYDDAVQAEIAVLNYIRLTEGPAAL